MVAGGYFAVAGGLVPEPPMGSPKQTRPPAQVQVPAPPSLLPELDSLLWGPWTRRTTTSCDGDAKGWSQSRGPKEMQFVTHAQPRTEPCNSLADGLTGHGGGWPESGGGGGAGAPGRKAGAKGKTAQVDTGEVRTQAGGRGGEGCRAPAAGNNLGAAADPKVEGKADGWRRHGKRC